MIDSYPSDSRLTEAQHRWLRHLREQAVSGLSMAAYARQQGLSISTFYAMRQRLCGLVVGWCASTTFIPGDDRVVGVVTRR
ncbi:MAG: IS66 family insertion sequence element accessory protein TnpA [Syntrophales bacterium]